MSNIYQFKAQSIDGTAVPLSTYQGKVLLIVNTASKCGFTSQYHELESLHAQYSPRGFNVLGFPCNQFGGQEPGSDEQIATFCRTQFSIQFPLFAKTDVKGPNAHPLFSYLCEQLPGLLGIKSIKWNFTKFLIDANGQPQKRYAPKTTPQNISDDIEDLLKHHLNQG